MGFDGGFGGMPNPADPNVYNGSGQWQPGQQPNQGNGGPTGFAMGGQGGPLDTMFGLGGDMPMGGMLNGILGGGNTPQMRGQGIQEPAPFVPYSPGGGLQFSPTDPYAGQRNQQGQGGMTVAPTGWDMSSPGVAEQWQQGNQQRFLDPTKQSQFFDETKGTLSQNLDPFYNNAERRALEQLNTQMASRGLFNSSAAIGAGNEAVQNLEAEKANREGQYGLQRAGLMGNLAQGADTSTLQNLGAGFGAAQTAEEAHRQRAQDYLSNLMGVAAPTMAAAAGTYNQQIGSDLDLMRDAMMAELGLAGEAQGNQQRTDETAKSDTERTAGLFGNVLGGVMGGK
jgi:hypothetical protein